MLKDMLSVGLNNASACWDTQLQGRSEYEILYYIVWPQNAHHSKYQIWQVHERY